MMYFRIGKCPDADLTFSNHLYLNPLDSQEVFKNVDRKTSPYLKVTIEAARKSYVFAITDNREMGINQIGVNNVIRKWWNVTLNSPVQAEPCQVNAYLMSLTVEIDFLTKQQGSHEKYNTDVMADGIRSNFRDIPLAKLQEFVFKFENKKPYLLLRVVDMHSVDHTMESSTDHDVAILAKNTTIVFDRKLDSTISLTGKAVGKSAAANIINPDWDFSKMGIGGLDAEFSAIFRRAFASRVFPPDLIDKLGMTHVKGILLYGPPGTGKTLMARKVGRMLNTRDPKLVNGPEILNKYVGESEKNIRELFVNAEADEKIFGMNSPLHMIIFDEIDAICKQRGTSNTGVADTVVNQLLSKIDGVEQLNNILIIGMTNRKDMIDEALLRPGRLEVQMEIGLPSEEGRVQILKIHTAKLKESGKLGETVCIEDIAKETKNFSGAELEGLVRAATTTAMNRLIKVDRNVTIDHDAQDNLRVTAADFREGILKDIIPKFGTGSDDCKHFLADGVISYGPPIEAIFRRAEMLINQTKNGLTTAPVTLLLQGPEGSGKTTIAATIAYKASQIPCVKVCSPEKMIGFSENAKCQAIKQIFDDAARSELSCIIVDDIERLLDYVPIGYRFSNLVLQTLIVLLKRNVKHGKRLLIIGTSCLDNETLANLQLSSCFHTKINVPTITDIHYLGNVLREMGREYFNEENIIQIKKQLASCNIGIDIKRLMSHVDMASEVDDITTVVPQFVDLLRITQAHFQA